MRPRYEHIREVGVSSDGTEVPISLWRRCDTLRDISTRPLLLEGYGAYGRSYSLPYDIPAMKLMDLGWTIGVAHVRGGGEGGNQWHKGGSVLMKRNSFIDFAACAKHLIQEGYVKKDKIVARGSSAGGLLVAATMNEEPRLFSAAILHAPFVDVYNTMQDKR